MGRPKAAGSGHLEYCIHMLIVSRFLVTFNIAWPVSKDVNKIEFTSLLVHSANEATTISYCAVESWLHAAFKEGDLYYLQLS